MYNNKYINSFNFSIVCIFVFCLILFISGYARFGTFFIDTSREAYVPMAMNNGNILYKDIFNVYAPLGYQLNAFLYFLFEESLNTLYIAGFINCILFLTGFFMICRLFLKEHTFLPLLMTLFISSASAFCISLDNYIFPYSYSIVYAMTAFIWSLFFLLKYIQNDNFFNLALSFFFFGMNISFKYEYIFFALVIFLIPFIKHINIKEKIICFLCFLFVPSVSLSILIFQGCELSDLHSAIIYMLNLSGLESVKICYETQGLIPSQWSCKNLIIYSIKTFSFLVISFLLIYNILLKFKIKYIKIFSIAVFSVLCIYILFPVFYESNSAFFCQTGICSFIILLLLILKKKFKYDDFDKMFLILNISAVLISFKSICYISFANYGNFFFPFLFIVLIVFTVHYFPKFFKEQIALKEFIITLNILLILGIILFSLSNYARRLFAFPSPINTQKGTIYVDKEKTEAINKTLYYIKNNTARNDKITVFPEGAMINFLSDRMSDKNYYYLIPPNIEIFGEENIVKDLENNLPDYIIIQPMSYNNYKETYFCESFGTKICALIPKYYEKPIVFGSDFWIAVYKKKEKNGK